MRALRTCFFFLAHQSGLQQICSHLKHNLLISLLQHLHCFIGIGSCYPSTYSPSFLRKRYFSLFFYIERERTQSSISFIRFWSSQESMKLYSSYSLSCWVLNRERSALALPCFRKLLQSGYESSSEREGMIERIFSRFQSFSQILFQAGSYSLVYVFQIESPSSYSGPSYWDSSYLVISSYLPISIGVGLMELKLASIDREISDSVQSVSSINTFSFTLVFQLLEPVLLLLLPILTSFKISYKQKQKLINNYALRSSYQQTPSPIKPQTVIVPINHKQSVNSGNPQKREYKLQ